MTPHPLVFWHKKVYSKGNPEKNKGFLFAEPLKSWERVQRKQKRTKKQGNSEKKQGNRKKRRVRGELASCFGIEMFFLMVSRWHKSAFWYRDFFGIEILHSHSVAQNRDRLLAGRNPLVCVCVWASTSCTLEAKKKIPTKEIENLDTKKDISIPTNFQRVTPKNQPEFFCLKFFLHPPGVVHVCAFGSGMSAPKCFQVFEGLPEVFDPRRPHEWGPGCPQNIRPENFRFGLLFLF